MKLVPTIYPLSGLPAEAIPAALPPFSGAVDGAMTAASWRFLVRLNPDGGVAECVSLEKAARRARWSWKTGCVASFSALFAKAVPLDFSGCGIQ